MVHITNGDSVAGMIRQWTGEPRLIVWRDILHEGPVRAGRTLEALSAERAAFLGGGEPEFEERDRAMRRLVQRDAVWLWFEDDLYDQLQLLQILDFFYNEGLSRNWVFFVDIPRRLELDQMAGFAAAKRPVPPAAFELGARAWQHFTSGTIDDLLPDDLTPLPALRPAIERLLEHYPDANGFNRVERTILSLLAAGPQSAPALFGAYQQTEERPFLGDLTFYDYLDQLDPLAARNAAGLYELHPGSARVPRERWVGGRLFPGR
ncbi:MAG: DUF1835 domain-containing protein [Acidobacteria bacterium]|nr:DUF1835 domain-containing protein [Acidobacteriota bacterium]